MIEGHQRTATWSGVPSGRPAGSITLEVVALVDGTVWRAASADGIVESPAGDGTSTYGATYVLPGVGTWVERWRDTEPDPDVVTDEVIVVDVPESAPPALPADLPPWAPSVEEVAGVTPAYTRGGFDDDDPEDDELVPGVEHATYDEGTSPTRGHVEALIRTACEEVAGRVGQTIPVRYYGLARAAAKWHVAAVIAGGKQPAGTDDAAGEYRTHIANFRAALDRLVYLCSLGPTRLA